MRALGLLICFTALSACSGGDAALKDPNKFTIYWDNGVLNGTYNPAGWTSESVKNLIPLDHCKSQRLATYKESPLDNGLIAFHATCA